MSRGEGGITIVSELCSELLVLLMGGELCGEAWLLWLLRGELLLYE